MPCSLCYDFGHNAKSCWIKCLPLYYDNNYLKVRYSLKVKMDGRQTAKRDEDKKLSKKEYYKRLKISREILWSAKPDYVINSLNELPKIIYHLNNHN